jgi:D-sorbitol dehydrogenase (acceptor)
MMNDTGRLAGKHAILTGAAGGIGLSVAAAYLREGAACTVADIGAAPSEALATLMSAVPGKLIYVPTDVSDGASVARLIDQADAAFGAADILFNNAAVFDMAPLLESDEAMYQRLFDVNVKGMFFTMQKVLAQMVAQ